RASPARSGLEVRSGRAGPRAQNIRPSSTMRVRPDWARAYLYRVGPSWSAGYLTGPRASPLDPAYFDSISLE
ncbi:hypothetical protein TorRG33x02_009620, partial [Trema orientale]